MQENFGLIFRTLMRGLMDSPNERKTKGGGGVKLRRGENTPQDPSPKTVLDPPTYEIPICSRPVIFLRGNGHRPDESHFLRPPKLVLEPQGGTLQYVFPPAKSHDTFCPPFAVSKSVACGGQVF